YRALSRVSQEAQWEADTDVSSEHDAAAEAANKAYAAFNGNPALITEGRELLRHRAELKPITVRQIEQVLLNAPDGPMTSPELVDQRVAAEVKQESTLNGFVFQMNGKPIAPNEIDDLLQKSKSLPERKLVWESSKQSGPALKPGLIQLRTLRNG